MRKLFLALALCLGLVCCKEPECDVSCKGHECSCKADKADIEECDLPEEVTPSTDLTSKG